MGILLRFGSNYGSYSWYAYPSSSSPSLNLARSRNARKEECGQGKNRLVSISDAPRFHPAGRFIIYLNNGDLLSPLCRTMFTTTIVSDSPPVKQEATLSKLQKLSLASKTESRVSLTSLARSARGQRSQPEERPALTPREQPQGSALKDEHRPQSKLALLAAQNKVSALKQSGTSAPSAGLSKLAQKINSSRTVAKQGTVSVSAPAKGSTLPQWELYHQQTGIFKPPQPSTFGKIITNVSDTTSKPVPVERSSAIQQIIGKFTTDTNTTSTFDSPSPDDVVLYARRGTTLARPVNSKQVTSMWSLMTYSREGTWETRKASFDGPYRLSKIREEGIKKID